jgi:hypothetical protein
MPESTTQVALYLLSNDFVQHFFTEDNPICLSNAEALPLTINDLISNDILEQATKLLSYAPFKQCSLDPAHTWLIKHSATLLHLLSLLYAMCRSPELIFLTDYKSANV